MNKPNQDIHHGIPLAVAQVTLLLLRKALDERNRMLKLGAHTPGLTLWLNPNGQLVYKRRRVRPRKSAATNPQPLLIHEFRQPAVGRIALVSRLICWVVDGNCSTLPNLMTERELADAYMKGFFHEIQDGAACEKGRQALANLTKRGLLERQLSSQTKRLQKVNRSRTTGASNTSGLTRDACPS